VRVIIGCGGPLRTALSGGIWGADGGGDCCLASQRLEEMRATRDWRFALPRTDWRVASGLAELHSVVVSAVWLRPIAMIGRTFQPITRECSEEPGVSGAR
jgi:hypothetical protein